MGRDDWYRNTEWDPKIEAGFFEKLERARDKAQYLRIQAGTLTTSRPDIALRLLDQFLSEYHDNYDVAQAHVDRATAFVALNNWEDAALAYEAALAREVAFPNVRTQACLEYPFLIARKRLRQHYERAVAVLVSHEHAPAFPVDFFRWNCAMALIRAEQGDLQNARAAAQNALAAAARTRSGFWKHPKIGLATDIEPSLRQRLSELAA
jgi:hypothetical protein